jgi:predicted methyltransferase
MTVQARLAAKLLRGRALAAAVADETRTESEVRRDKFGNRW